MSVHPLIAFADALWHVDDLVELRRITPARADTPGAKPKTRQSWMKVSEVTNPATLAMLAEENAAGANIYAVINPLGRKRGKDEDVVVARSFFVDFDGGVTADQAKAKIRAAFLPHPSLVLSSGHGTHCYWLLDKPGTDLNQWRGVQQALIDLLMSDPVIKNPSRVMRLPGFKNCKSEPHVEATLVEVHSDRRYTLDQFPAPSLPARIEVPTKSRIVAPAAVAASGGQAPNPINLSRTTLLFLHQGASEGERNIALFRAACDYAGNGIAQDQAERELGDAARRSGLLDGEITSTIASAYSKMRTASRPTPIVSGTVGADTTHAGTLPEGVVSAPHACSISYTPFPTDALPEPALSFVLQSSAAIGCDSCYVALPLLVALASAIGNTRRIRLKRKWSEPAILWGTTIGRSGTTKTPGMDAGLEAVRKFQADAFKIHVLETKTFDDAQLRHEVALSAWRKKAGGNPDAAGDAPVEPERPTAKRVLTSDTTTEALAPILLDNPRGLLVANDELASWIGAFDRYSGGRGGADAARWLSMHSGGPLLIDRKDKNKPTISVPEAVVSVVGGIQPGILRRALGQQHRDNGLAARLLLAFPPPRKRVWTEDDLSAEAEAAIGAVFDVLYALETDADDSGTARARLLTLSPEAKVVWIAFFNKHAQEQVELPDDLAAAWSKLEAYAPRFALVIHLVRCAAGDPSLQRRDEVDEVSMAAGVVLAEWFGGEAKRVYAMLDDEEENPELRKLEDLVRRLGGVASPRDVQKATRRYKTAEEAEAGLNELVKAGRGRWEWPKPGPTGGYPTKRVRLAGSASADTTPRSDGASGGSVDTQGPCEPSGGEWGRT